MRIPPLRSFRALLQCPLPSLVGLALLGAAAAICFAPVIVLGGMPFEDTTIVRHNPLIRDAAGLRALWWPAPADHVPFFVDHHYWPLLYTTFWLEHRLYGGRPAVPLHAANLALHTLNAWLLWRLLRRHSAPVPLLAAALFALYLPVAGAARGVGAACGSAARPRPRRARSAPAPVGPCCPSLRRPPAPLDLGLCLHERRCLVYPS